MIICYDTPMNNSYRLLELPSIAREVWEHITASRTAHHATVVCLHGDLGAGKTTLVTELAKLLNIEQSIQSPTFVILKNYALENLTPDPSPGNERVAVTYFKNFIHIDAYRLHDAVELEKLDWSQYVSNPEHLICIEWSENVPDCIPAEHIDVYLTHMDNETRNIEIT
jgi:tRNA threonylcarbamoyladenosine biosynthesis protein TsaE